MVCYAPATGAVLCIAEVFELYDLVLWNLNCLEISIAITAGGVKIQFKTSGVV